MIDALLFVFGYRASKMRQPKASDLIHFSEAFPHVEQCSVQIHFHEIIDLPDKSYQIVPGSQLLLERVAYKSNKSDYLINGKSSSYTQVTALLKEKGVDLDHNRFLILQGEVESIALMKPKASNEHEEGLLEYLEDIIGTNKYAPMIEEAIKVVDTTGQEANQKISQFRILEKEKLSKQVAWRAICSWL